MEAREKYVDPSVGQGELVGATRVYGNSRAAWFRDGHYYDRGGTEVSAELAAQPEFEVVAEPESVVETAPTYAPSPVEPAPGAEPVVVTDDRAAKLAGMHPKRLAAMVRLAGGDPAVGKGSVAANKRWLLEHTE